ncbi:hypothetical protein T459_23011 [Capsicum annuum]|uniref:Uncharacterized protein n=1 Tax=Capsicum annuum TaxID=4072 RepID=A0A2G2YR47_CAPAN|nr:hypothetical protein T459_23011 [Capsicum annuum]
MNMEGSPNSIAVPPGNPNSSQIPGIDYNHPLFIHSSDCKGHTKDACYKLEGYPNEFKSKKKMEASHGHAAYNMSTEPLNEMPSISTYAHDQNTNGIRHQVQEQLGGEMSGPAIYNGQHFG